MSGKITVEELVKYIHDSKDFHDLKLRLTILQMYNEFQAKKDQTSGGTQ